MFVPCLELKLATARLLVGLLAIGMAIPAGAQSPPPQGKTFAASAGVFAYPAKGQAHDQQAKAAQQELAATFKRGMSACLEARGYTVK